LDPRSRNSEISAAEQAAHEEQHVESAVSASASIGKDTIPAKDAAEDTAPARGNASNAHGKITNSSLEADKDASSLDSAGNNAIVNDVLDMNANTQETGIKNDNLGKALERGENKENSADDAVADEKMVVNEQAAVAAP
jgi:hypothetical protein